MPAPDRPPPWTALVDRLAAEEAVLRDTLGALSELHAAVRRADHPAIAAARPRQERLLTLAAERAAARSTAAAELAVAVGLSPAGVTLSALADRLPEPAAAGLRAARDRLAALAAEISSSQRRNANLVCYLRSYFRGALTGSAGLPARYGRDGSAVG